jgi:hypothetical protein
MAIIGSETADYRKDRQKHSKKKRTHVGQTLRNRDRVCGFPLRLNEDEVRSNGIIIIPYGIVGSATQNPAFPFVLDF